MSFVARPFVHLCRIVLGFTCPRTRTHPDVLETLHETAFTTCAVKEFRQDSAVDEAHVLCTECTGAPCYPFMCTARDRGTRVRSRFLMNAGRPASFCYLCQLGVLYERLYQSETPHTTGSRSGREDRVTSKFISSRSRYGTNQNIHSSF